MPRGMLTRQPRRQISEKLHSSFFTVAESAKGAVLLFLLKEVSNVPTLPTLPTVRWSGLTVPRRARAESVGRRG
jgi:hypothetical protein